MLEVITKYSPSLKALKEYDEGHITFGSGKRAIKFLNAEECTKIIKQLRENLGADEKFGALRSGELDFGDKMVGETVAEKAANLLYFVVKGQPFKDGNERIGALLFIVFLTMNDFHLTDNGETKISDRALTALTLLIAESDPSEKDLIIALICKLLEE
jgi:hypothetical protein